MKVTLLIYVVYQERTSINPTTYNKFLNNLFERNIRKVFYNDIESSYYEINYYKISVNIDLQVLFEADINSYTDNLLGHPLDPFICLLTDSMKEAVKNPLETIKKYAPYRKSNDIVERKNDTTLLYELLGDVGMDENTNDFV